MMGGGVCWLDYNNDGWLDLFVVNSYADDNLPAWQDHGGLPTSALYENVHGHFVDVTKSSHAGLPLKGEGCVAADFNGDGYTDLFITTATDDALLWNNGNGTFTEGARKAGIVSFGWHSGATVADVNGDGRPDLFVAGYSDAQHPIETSIKGFPSNYPGVRDELFLNLGDKHFREVGVQAGLDPEPYDHSLGAEFTDVNGDGRPDLLVANDEDPNRLYLNEPGGPLGFHFVDVAHAKHIADKNAGMGIAYARGLLFVSNSRGQTHAVYRQVGLVVHGYPQDLCPRVRRERHRVGRCLGRPTQRRHAAARAGERCDPRHEPAQGRSAAAGSDPEGRAVDRHGHPAEPARERARPRRGRLRQRRPGRPGREHDRRQPSAPPQHEPSGQLARGWGAAVLARRRRHGRRLEWPAAGVPRCTLGRATSHPRTRASTSGSARRRSAPSPCATPTVPSSASQARRRTRSSRYGVSGRSSAAAGARACRA